MNKYSPLRCSNVRNKSTGWVVDALMTLPASRKITSAYIDPGYKPPWPDPWLHRTVYFGQNLAGYSICFDLSDRAHLNGKRSFGPKPFQSDHCFILTQSIKIVIITVAYIEFIILTASF